MNKNKWIKIILAILIIALMGSLAACNKTTPPPVVEDPPTEEVDLFDQIVEIVKSVNPLVATLNGITADSTVGLDAGIGVDYNFGAGGNYSLGIKGNVKKTNPELQITVQDNKNTTDPNWVLLAYKDAKAYLKQPLTAVNTAVKTETTSADLTAISGDINIIMDVLMYKLAGLNIDIDFEKLGQSLEDMVNQLGGLDLSTLISITKTGDVNKLVINSGAAKQIVSIVYNLAISDGTNAKTDMESIVDTVVNTLIPAANKAGFAYLTGKDFVFPTIFIEAGITSGALSKVSLGIDFTGVEGAGDNANKYAKLNIDLTKFSTTETATIATPDYVTKSLQLGLGANMLQKGISADLLLNITGNMIEAKNGVLGNGTLTVKNGNTTAVAEGFYNGQAAYFDFKDTFAAIGAQAANGNVYKATYDMYTAMHNSLLSWQADMKAEPAPVVEEGEPGLSLFQSIYDMLGGDVNTLQVVNGVKVDPTATQMLTLVKAKIGDYVRFDIPTTSYADALTAVTNAWNTNKDTVKTIIDEVAPWGDVADNANWIGELYLTKTGDNNDLLDAVNLFVCNGKTDGTPNPIDVAFLTEKANRYLALILRSSKNSGEALDYNNAVKALDDKLLFARNTYLAAINASGATPTQIAAAEAAYKEAKDAHYDALAFPYGLNGIEGDADDNKTADYFANLVMEQIFGYTGTTGNYLADFINSGVTVKVTCTKAQGLNGAIRLFGNTNTAELEYVTISGSMKIVAKDVTTGTDIVLEDAKELTTCVDVLGTDVDEEDYRIIQTWEDGTKKIDMDLSTETALVYLYVMDGENYTYDKRYTNFEGLQSDLWTLLEAYKAVMVPQD